MRQTEVMFSLDQSIGASGPTFSAVTLALLLTACGVSGADPTETSEASAQDATQLPPTAEDELNDDGADEYSAGDETAGFDDSALGQMNAYVFELINTSDPSDASDWEDSLDETFMAEMSAEEFAEFINQSVQPGEPWGLEEFTPFNEYTSLSVIDSEVGRFGMELSLDPETELINGLLFNPLPEPGNSVESFDELAEKLDELPVEISMLVVEDDETLYKRASDQVMPLSSTSKLYVLYGLVQAIEADEAEWNDTLVLSDELRSLPSGQLQEEDAGYEISVAGAARMMISISDNTATDMIIDYLGRDTVEEAVAEAHHHDPDLLTPYLSTGNLFQLRWADSELGEEYLDADMEHRSEILKGLDHEILNLNSTEMSPEAASGPDLEWYATAEDVAAVHQALSEARDDHPELTEILTKNPGLVKEPEGPWWEEIAFKGGNTFETLSGSWTLSDAQGRERNVVVLVHSEDPADVQPLEGAIFGLSQEAFALE